MKSKDALDISLKLQNKSKDQSFNQSGCDMKKKILIFALPVSIEIALYMFLGVIDQIFVAFLGDTKVAAVGLTNQVFFTCDLTLGALGIGMSIVLARFFGNQAYDKFAKTSCQFFVLSATVGLVVWAAFFFGATPIMRFMGADSDLLVLSTHFFKIASWGFPFLYMSEILNKVFRAMGDTNTPMVVTVFSLGLNTVLNYIMVFGFGPIQPVGMTGVACATVVARAVGFLIICTLLYIKLKGIVDRLPWRHATNLRKLKPVINLSLPVFGGEAIRNAGLLLFMALAARVQTEALVAYQIVFNIETFFIIFSYGFCTAGLILVGHELGKNNTNEALSLASIILSLTFKVSCITGFLTVCMIFFIGAIYPAISEEAIRMTFIGFCLLGVFQPIKSIGIVFRNGILRSGGDNHFLLVTELVSTGFGLCVAWALSMHYQAGIVGIFAGNIVGEVLRVAVYTARYREKTWIHATVI